jgi:hypothetical protein
MAIQGQFSGRNRAASEQLQQQERLHSRTPAVQKVCNLQQLLSKTFAAGYAASKTQTP